MQIHQDPYSLESQLAATQFAVEANSFEALSLWRENHKKVSWEQHPLGFGVNLGTLADMPVVLSVTFQRIDGHIVMFYHVTSQVADYRMVDAWLEKNITARWDHESRRVLTDAMNFHLCLHALADLNTAAKKALAEAGLVSNLPQVEAVGVEPSAPASSSGQAPVQLANLNPATRTQGKFRFRQGSAGFAEVDAGDKGWQGTAWPNEELLKSDAFELNDGKHVLEAAAVN